MKEFNFNEKTVQKNAIASACFEFKNGMEMINIPIIVLSVYTEINDNCRFDNVVVVTSHGKFVKNHNGSSDFKLTDSPDSDTTATLLNAISEKSMMKELKKHDKYLASIDKNFKKWKITSEFAVKIRNEYANLGS